MTTIYGYNTPWYAGKIQDILTGLPEDVSSDKIAECVCRLHAAAMVASAIDTAFSNHDDNFEAPYLKMIAQAIDGIDLTPDPNPE